MHSTKQPFSSGLSLQNLYLATCGDKHTWANETAVTANSSMQRSGLWTLMDSPLVSMRITLVWIYFCHQWRLMLSLHLHKTSSLAKKMPKDPSLICKPQVPRGKRGKRQWTQSKALKSRSCQPPGSSSSILKSPVLPRSNWHRWYQQEPWSFPCSQFLSPEEWEEQKHN